MTDNNSLWSDLWGLIWEEMGPTLELSLQVLIIALM